MPWLNNTHAAADCGNTIYSLIECVFFGLDFDFDLVLDMVGWVMTSWSRTKTSRRFELDDLENGALRRGSTLKLK